MCAKKRKKGPHTRAVLGAGDVSIEAVQHVAAVDDSVQALGGVVGVAPPDLLI